MKKLYDIIILFLASTSFVFAQNEQTTEQIRVTGSLIDSENLRVVNPFYRNS